MASGLRAVSTQGGIRERVIVTADLLDANEGMLRESQTIAFVAPPRAGMTFA